MPGMTEAQARQEICRVGRSLFERGYVHGTAGNISVRLEAEQGGGFLITPTDACLGFLLPERLSRIDADGKHVSGDAASKTLALHALIYVAASPSDPRTCCIIHTHSTHCVALTLQPQAAAQPELLDALTPYFVMKVGRVPIIAYRRPGDPAAAQAVAQAISTYAAAGMPVRAVMLARLGPTVWHDSPASAMATLEELEATAQLACTATTPPEPLGLADIDELRRTFGARW